MCENAGKTYTFATGGRSRRHRERAVVKSTHRKAQENGALEDTTARSNIPSRKCCTVVGIVGRTGKLSKHIQLCDNDGVVAAVAESAESAESRNTHKTQVF